MDEFDPVISVDLTPLEARLPPEYPQVWRQIATSLYVRMRRSDVALTPMTPETLAQLVLELTLGLANDMGGDMLYIPIGHFLRAGETARTVISAFRGNNHHECAKAAGGITVSRVRQILREHQRTQFELRQGKLAL